MELQHVQSFNSILANALAITKKKKKKKKKKKNPKNGFIDKGHDEYVEGDEKFEDFEESKENVDNKDIDIFK